MEFVDSDKQLSFLRKQNCFSQEVLEANFGMGCVIGEKLTPRRFEGNIVRGNNQGGTDGFKENFSRPLNDCYC